MNRLFGWFWRRRDHGYRGGDMLRCARCGAVEYSERHPRGYWLHGLTSRWDGRFLR
jgi:hypothetical protein